MAKVGDEVIIKVDTTNYSEHRKLADLNLHNTVCRLVHRLNDGTFITDKFFPDFIFEKSDYFHYGFLKLLDYDFRVLPSY